MRDTARFFKVLGDEARLKMLWLLFNHRELCVCDFVMALEVTQSKASRHLRTLWHAGLVTDRKEGLWSYYSLRASQADDLRPHLDALRKSLARWEGAAALLERLRGWLSSEPRVVVPHPTVKSRVRPTQKRGAPQRTRRTTRHG